MFARKKKRAGVKNDQALLSEALTDFLHDQQIKEKRKRRRKWRWPEWLDKRVAIGLAVILIAIIADAVRRENQEFYATVRQSVGIVTVRTPDNPREHAPLDGEKLADRSHIRTGAKSWAELLFSDGSRVVVDENSDLYIKLLEYHRGGRWRSRSFYLMAGRIIARISQNFGADSNFRVYTPACVAAARGTRFSVRVEASGQAQATVGEGVVEVQGFRGQRVWVRQRGATQLRAGAAPAMPTYAAPAELSVFRSRSMIEYIPPEPWYKIAEMTLTQVLDAPLTILGIGKCSWALGAADFARRAAAQEALRKIFLNLEGDMNYPLWVNPATLRELNIQEEGGVEMILKNFDGGALESYWSDGRNFRITARARDRQRTRYELDMRGVHKAENQD